MGRMQDISASEGSRIAKLALSAALAVSLGAAPLLAFADNDDAAPQAGETAAAESDTEAASPDSPAVPAVKHGLQATAPETIFSNGGAIAVTDSSACGLFAENGATIVANDLDISASGDQGAAIATAAQGGNVSIANSRVSTGGSDAPLLFSAGTIEADNVTGTAAKAGIARIENQGSILLANSKLTSSFTGSSTSDPIANVIALYGTEANDAANARTKTALFQASGCALSSNLEKGALFYLTNTTASIILADTDLDFNADKVKLLAAAGTDAAGSIVTTRTAPTTWGAAGTNGATVTLTALDQDLKGDITVDSISSVDLFLLENSSWTGTSDITSNSAGSEVANNIVVNIDATSGWTVTENATVSTLNIAKGGSLVDEDGKAVTIVDADGNKLVDGASDIRVSVIDEFSTTVKTTNANGLQASTIDRSAFDAESGTSTAFGTNGSGIATSDEERAAALAQIIAEWFRNL